MNNNPYLKKYGPGGKTEDPPYDPTTSYIRPKKVIVDGKEMSTYSNEYRDLYNTGTLMTVDSDGIPSMYGPEVEVTAKMTDKEREKRRVEAQGRVADAVRKGTGSFARPILDTGFEMSGAAGAVRFAQDPIKNLKGTANILSYTNVPGLIGHGIDYAMGNPFFNVTQEDLQGLTNTLDVAGLATFGAGTAFKMAPKAISSIPRMLGKIPDVNPNMGLRFADETIDAQKALQKNQNTINEIITPEGFQNRVFDKNMQLGTYQGKGHMSENGYIYRTLGNEEIEAIQQTGGVFPRVGKAKGGNTNVKYWTKGNEHNWYGSNPQQQFIRVKENNFNYDKVINANDVEVWNHNTKKFEPIKSFQNKQGILPESSMSTVAKASDDVTAQMPNAKEIEQITTYKNDLLNRLKTSEEGKRRLANLGLTPEDLNDIDLYFNAGGSRAMAGRIDYNGNPYVNINFKEIAGGTGLTPINTASHEIGHALQYLAAKKRFEKLGIPVNDRVYSGVNIRTQADDEMIDWLKSVNQSEIDFKKSMGTYDQLPGINQNLTNKNIPEGINKTYITERAEPYAHLREFRTNMMDEGILKNEWDNVTEDMVDKFMKTSSGDRMKASLQNTPDFRKRMSILLNKYPAVVPAAIGAGTIGASMMQQPKEKFRTGGSVNPYLSYNNGGKVIIDGKEVSTSSQEYKDLYEAGVLMGVDYEGLPNMYAPEVEVTAKMTDKERVKRGLMTESQRRDKSAMSELVNEFANQTGISGAYKFAKDPIGTLGNAAGYFEDLMMASHSMPKQVMNPGEYKPEHVEGLMNTLDVAGFAAAGLFGKQSKNIIPQLKSFGNNIFTKPKRQSLEWMNEWYGSPEFLSRYSQTGKYDEDAMQEHILDLLKEYEPKNYFDLWKDKGFKEYADGSLTSSGVSYGTPDNIYINRTLLPFKKGRESTRTHELTHLIEYNGINLSEYDNEELLKPFGYNNYEEIIPDKKSFLSSPGKQYYLKPTEIHARMNQARYDLNLKPTDVFTEEMFNKINKSSNWYGMGKYIKDKKSFIDLMNNFWAVAPAAMTTGAAATIGASQLNQQAPQNRYGGQNPYITPKYANGGPIDPVDPEDEEAAMRGMMKARIAIDSHFGNPAAKRLTSPYVNPYVFSGNEKYDGVELGVPSGSTGTHFMSSMGMYAVPFIQQNKEGNLYYNENASPSDVEAMKFETEKEAEYFANENYKKVAPLMKNWGKFKSGGDTESTVEIERSERVYTPDGKLIMETPADAPTHEEGGVKVKLKPGSLVFPLKYFKALDAASGLPAFKKIADTMLDNAEKAYLSGEPYSSGGKRDKERTYNA